MTGHTALVDYDSDTADWVVVFNDRQHSTHGTKQEAIDAACEISVVSQVQAFTKGRTGIQTVSC